MSYTHHVMRAFQSILPDMSIMNIADFVRYPFARLSFRTAIYTFASLWMLGIISVSPAVSGQFKGATDMSISEGRQVSIEYTLKLEDKTIVDSNVGAAPLTYVHGARQIIPGLENSLTGMKVGDKKEVTVKPEDGYGLVDTKALVEVDKEQIPADSAKIGSQLQGRDNDGNVFTARVTEIKDNKVVLDFNHPLAGKTLYFEVRVLNILEVPQP